MTLRKLCLVMCCLLNVAVCPNGLAGTLVLTSGATLLGTVDRRDNLSQSNPVLTRDQTYTFSYSDPNRVGVEQGSFDAMGLVRYGVLQASVSSAQTGSIAGSLATVFSSALWQDTMTFNAASAGTAVLIFHLSGSSTSPTSAGDGVQSTALVRFYGGVFTGTLPFTDYTITNSTLNTSYASAPIAFTPGVPVTVEGTVGTNLTLYCTANSNPSACNSWSASGIVDFGHTAYLTGIQLFDQNNAPIQNFTVTSGSGTQYTAAGVVPEPACIFSFGLGLSALAALCFRKRSPRS